MAIGPGWIERVSRPNIERHERSRRAFLDLPLYHAPTAEQLFCRRLPPIDLVN